MLIEQGRDLENRNRIVLSQVDTNVQQRHEDLMEVNKVDNRRKWKRAQRIGRQRMKLLVTSIRKTRLAVETREECKCQGRRRKINRSK